ncbi:hypothetical protein J437_LFUL014068 [Ladona fulva]|uniref:Endonuclease/exonuclease/phosphatase domain-containing protein n=1 Tax=Ladona fulva TaxID=123851 RepID=A0A8K0KLG9_LADFU|nr:hypothetical protein J437_LFUL014068 [Ladona fulva]
MCLVCCRKREVERLEEKDVKISELEESLTLARGHLKRLEFELERLRNKTVVTVEERESPERRPVAFITKTTEKPQGEGKNGVDTRASSEEETSRRGNERRITSRTKGFTGNIIKIKSENRRDGVKEGGGEEEGGEEGVRRESGVNMVKEVEMDKRSADIIFEADAAGGETLGRNDFLKFLQVNCRSLVKKVVEFQSLIELHEPDVIICTETWLRKEISDSEIFTCNYHTFRRDRFTKGGGVCICVNKELQSSVKRVDQEHEILSVDIRDTRGKKLEVIAAYRPPSHGLGCGIQGLPAKADAQASPLSPGEAITSEPAARAVPKTTLPVGVECAVLSLESGRLESTGRV